LRLRQRNYPYPVLTPFEVADKNYKFNCDLVVEEEVQLSILRFQTNFILKNKVLQQLINEEKAVFALHLECPSTMQRLLFTSFSPKDTFEVNVSLLNKTVDINFFILANSDITGYENIEIDKYSEGFSFSLAKGDTLAIGVPETLEIQKEPIIEMNSIFELVITTNKNAKPLTIDLSGEKIRIHLTKANFELMAHLHTATLSKADTILAAIYYTPAMVEALYHIKEVYEARDDMRIEEIRDTAWFKSIKARLHSISIDIESLPSDNLVGIAHEMLDDPNKKAMLYVKELEEGEY